MTTNKLPINQDLLTDTMPNSNVVESLPLFPMKLSELAKRLKLEQDIDFTPTRSRDTDAGFDVKACIGSSIVMDADISKVVTIPTGIFIDLEEYGQYLPANEVLIWYRDLNHYRSSYRQVYNGYP